MCKLPDSTRLVAPVLGIHNFHHRTFQTKSEPNKSVLNLFMVQSQRYIFQMRVPSVLGGGRVFSNENKSQMCPKDEFQASGKLCQFSEKLVQSSHASLHAFLLEGSVI